MFFIVFLTIYMYNYFGDIMNGILLINKEKDYTSRDVVNIVSKQLNIKRIGHTGTLDPLATGVLVLCIGKATTLVEVITNNEKEYIAEIILGISTDTLDITGQILSDETCYRSKAEIKKVLDSMIGMYNQEVPLYSAIKIDGKKLYEYARNKEKVKLPTRNVHIKELKLIDEVLYDNNKTIFKIKCLVSKGTYVRSLIRDIALKLNTVGVMNNLQRTKHGNYTIDECVTLEQFKNNNYEIKSIMSALNEFYKVVVDEKLEKRIKNGQILNNIYNKPKVLFVTENNIPLSIYQTYKKDPTKIKPWKMF